MSSARSTVAPARAVGRWAWRLFRRDWRAQLLVVALTVVAVATAVVGASMAIESTPDPAGEFGRAGALVRVSGDEATIQASVDAARQRFGDIEVIGVSTTSAPGALERIDVRAQDPAAPLGAPMLDVTSGRFPSGPSEVALTAGAADLLDASIGSTVDIEGSPRTVVGIVANPLDTAQQFALVDPDGAPTPSSVQILVADATNRAVGAGPVAGMVQLRDGQGDGQLVLVVVVVTLAMVLVGLIAAAGFVTIAQRRQRQLGLLAAVGASRRHLSWVMLAGGALVGITGAIVGTALGFVAWQVVRPSVIDSARRHIGPLELPWPLVVLIGALAVITSTAAAWWPARTASRIPVMAALSGRPVPPRPVHRPVLAGVALVALGALAIDRSGATQPGANQGLLVAGLLTVVVGVVVLAPAAVGITGRLAARLPLAARLAVRDLARHRSRAAASLAAITLALGVTVGIVVVAAGRDNSQGLGNLPADELLVHLAGDRDQPVPTVSLADQAELDARAATVAAAIRGEPSVLALDMVVNASAGSTSPPIGAARRTDAHTVELAGPLYVATAEVLARYGIDPATIDPGTDLLTSDPHVNGAADPTTPPGEGTLPTAVRDELPRYSSGPSTLVTEAALARHGWQAIPGTWLVHADHPLTADELTAARAAAARAGLAIESRSTGSGQDIITWTTRLGVALAILIVLMAVALIRADAAGDVRILTANGARPATRRAIAAATAATLGLLGGLLGTAGTYVVALATFHHDLSHLWPPPWPALVAIVVGLPIIAAALAWCTGGGEPRALARRPLD